MAETNTALDIALSEYRGKRFNVGGAEVKYDDVRSVLNTEFKFPEFKSPEQELLILKTLNGESVMGIMATGSGKSLVFLLPAFIRRTGFVSVVVSPLRALMSQFDAKHPWVAAMHSDVDDHAEIWRRIKSRKVHLLLIAPERLKNGTFKQCLIDEVKGSGRELGPFVLDEAHCVSDWGHDFRPEYWWAAEHITDTEKLLGRKEPIQKVFLTATADERVIHDVADDFGLVGRRSLPDEQIIRGPVARPEIFMAAIKCDGPEAKLRLARKFLERQATRPLANGVKRRVLVYTYEAVKGDVEGDDIDEDDARELRKQSRLKANKLADLLERESSRKCEITALPYASTGMNRDEKKTSEEFFVNASSKPGQVRAIVATSAFGMGMDYDKIPGVLHYYPRPTLSEYWQQIGRAGRGFDLDKGEWAEALAVYAEGDVNRAYWQATAQALDGIYNSFTIPGLGMLVAWDNAPGSSKVALTTPTGQVSKFSKFIYFLKEVGVLGKGRVLDVFPRTYGKAWGYPVNHGKLKRLADTLKDEAKGRGFESKHYRKYIRYLRISATGVPKNYILLHQGDYDLDRNQTVLSRITRWADVGALERDHRVTGPVAKFRVKKTKLTRGLVSGIKTKWDEWAAAKESDFNKQENVLANADHEKIVKLIHKAYGEKAKPRPASAYRNAEDEVPDWLKI